MHLKKPHQQGNILIGAIIMVAIIGLFMMIVDQKIRSLAHIQQKSRAPVWEIRWNERPERVLDDSELCTMSNLRTGIGQITTQPLPPGTILRTWSHDATFPNQGIHLLDDNGSPHWWRTTYSSLNEWGQPYGDLKMHLVSQGEQQATGGPRLIRFAIRTDHKTYNQADRQWWNNWGFLELDAANWPIACYGRSSSRGICRLQGKTYDPTLPLDQRCQ